MGKKVLFLIVLAALLLACIGILHHTGEQIPKGGIVEISLGSVKGITQQEAEELCFSVLGEKDADTGFAFSFATSGAVKRGKKQYYVIRASWFVNESHWSYIGDFFVSSDGKEIYSGTALMDEYTMDNIVWKK